MKGWADEQACWRCRSFGAASPALADGEMPPLPLQPRTFGSFTECRSFLDMTYKEDLRRADPTPVPSADGTTQTLIHSEGPKSIAAQQAVYDVTEGWKNRTPLLRSGQIMTSYSYKRTTRRCDANRLTGEVYTGYGLEGYEPAARQGH